MINTKYNKLIGIAVIVFFILTVIYAAQVGYKKGYGEACLDQGMDLVISRGNYHCGNVPLDKDYCFINTEVKEVK